MTLRNTLIAFLAMVAVAYGSLRHEYNFDVDGSDSVGTAHLDINGAAVAGGGNLVIPGGAPRSNNASASGAALTELAGTINGTDTLSIVVRYNTSVGQNWSKVFMAGDPGGEPALSYLDITPQRGGGQNHGATFNDSNGNEVGVNGLPVIPAGVDALAVAVFDEPNDLLTLYVAEDGNPGSLTDGTASLGGGDLGAVTVNEFYLGSAVNFGDPDFNGVISQVQIYDSALSASDVRLLVPEPAGMTILALGGLLLFVRHHVRRR